MSERRRARDFSTRGRDARESSSAVLNDTSYVYIDSFLCVASRGANGIARAFVSRRERRRPVPSSSRFC